MARKIRYGMAIFMIGAMLLQSVPVMAVQTRELSEEKIYTVTIRAGNVGTFRISDFLQDETITATKNYIKVKVEKGKTVADVVDGWTDENAFYAWLLEHVDIEKNNQGEPLYEIKPMKAVTEEVIKNTEYVLDYARIVENGICAALDEDGIKKDDNKMQFADCLKEIYQKFCLIQRKNIS